MGRGPPAPTLGVHLNVVFLLLHHFSDDFCLNVLMSQKCPQNVIVRGERVPGNGNGNAGNRPIRFQRISDYDLFLDTDSLIAQEHIDSNVILF